MILRDLLQVRFDCAHIEHEAIEHDYASNELCIDDITEAGREHFARVLDLEVVCVTMTDAGAEPVILVKSVDDKHLNKDWQAVEEFQLALAGQCSITDDAKWFRHPEVPATEHY